MCQEILRNIALAIKYSWGLSIKHNKSHQMNNAIKVQIYQKVHNITLWADVLLKYTKRSLLPRLL